MFKSEIKSNYILCQITLMAKPFIIINAAHIAQMHLYILKIKIPMGNAVSAGTVRTKKHPFG